MKKRRLSALAAVLALALLCGCGQSGTDAALRELDAYYNQTPVAPNEYLRALVWAHTGAGYDGWQDDCYAEAVSALEACDGILSNTKSTAYSAYILTLTAAGYDARDVAGYDLTEALTDVEFVQKQGINGPIFALLALDCGPYPAPDGVRDELVADILLRQLSDGGFAFSGERADPDITAMALMALASYRDRPEVAEAVDPALDTLSLLQGADGHYASFGVVNAESGAQVVMALAALGLAQEDARFVKNGVSALDALLAYRLADGTFAHEMQGDFNALATVQVYAALAAASVDGGLFACLNEGE